MMPAMLDYHIWVCPDCKLEHRTDRVLRNRFHHCPRHHGLPTPMVPDGLRAKVEVVWREDYVGREIVTLDERGRAPMAMRTVRDDGEDLAVFAPAVRVKIDMSSSGDLPSLRSLFWAKVRQAIHRSPN